jgi:uncharacterized protein
MTNQFQSTLPQNRIELLDVLRGFAICGVLFANIVLLSGYLFTPYTELGNQLFSNLNSYLNSFGHYMISGKFYPILMLLFGAGLFMQFKKRIQPGFTSFYYKRMILLAIIGGLHLIIWAGDVVSVYALFALFLFPLKGIRIKYYLYISIFLFAIHFIVGYFHPLWYPSLYEGPAEPVAAFQLPYTDPTTLIKVVQNEGWSGLRYITDIQLKFLWNLPRYLRITPSTMALFLLGAFLFGSGFFLEKAHKLKYILIFLVLGLSGTFLMYTVSFSFKIMDNLFLALFYISLLSALIRTKTGHKILSQLAPLGRMSLTNYILQSLFCIIIFYGIGLGLFGKVSLAIVYSIAIIILGLQIHFSKYWLKNHKYGPLEWLWRRLSYGKPIK